MTTIHYRCQFCAGVIDDPHHVIRIVDGYTVVACPRFPAGEKPLKLRTKIFKGIDG